MQYDCPKFKASKVIDIDSIASIHYFEFTDDFVDYTESHEPWELVYVDRGECNVVAQNEILLLKQGEMYFHKPGEFHKLSLIKGVTPNIFVMTFFSSSVAMSYFENRKIKASMATKQHISAIIHEASSTFDLPFNIPEMKGLKLKKNDTSADVLCRIHQDTDKESAAALRQVYLSARYDDRQNISREQVNAAKQALKGTKNRKK